MMIRSWSPLVLLAVLLALAVVGPGLVCAQDVPKKDAMLAKFKGKWKSAPQPFGGATVVLPLTFDAEGNATYEKYEVRGEQVTVSQEQKASLEVSKGQHVLKIYDCSYRCQFDNRGRLVLSLIGGSGPRSYILSRAK